MKIFVINLEKRKDRLFKVTNELRKHNLSASVFNAIHGNDFKVNYECKNNSTNGCSLSHWLIFKQAEKLGLDSYLVLEDDVILHHDFNTILSECFLKLPSEFDILYLGASHRLAPKKLNPYIYKLVKSLTTHAMFVNVNEKTKKVFDDFSFKQPLDAHIAERMDYLNCYITNPPLAWQAEGYSDIEQREMSYEWIKKEL